MAPLERFFVLEVEFHRKLRTVVAADAADGGGAYTRAMRCSRGMSRSCGSVGRVTVRDIEQVAAQGARAADARDVLAARDSLTRLLGIRPFESLNGFA